MHYNTRYASRAKNIKNSAKINEDPKDALLREFQKEIERLKAQLEEGKLRSQVIAYNQTGKHQGCALKSGPSANESSQFTRVQTQIWPETFMRSHQGSYIQVLEILQCPGILFSTGIFQDWNILENKYFFGQVKVKFSDTINQSINPLFNHISPRS